MLVRLMIKSDIDNIANGRIGKVRMLTSTQLNAFRSAFSEDNVNVACVMARL